jgi:hypothetical protein
MPKTRLALATMAAFAALAVPAQAASMRRCPCRWAEASAGSALTWST